MALKSHSSGCLDVHRHRFRRLAVALSVAAVAGATAGCGSAEPPQRRAIGSSGGLGRPLAASEVAAITGTAEDLGGGAAAFDGRPRHLAGPPAWAEWPQVVRRAVATEGVEMIVAAVEARTVAGDRSWDFTLVTADRQPGFLRLVETAGEPGFRVDELAVGHRAESSAMRRRAGRLLAAIDVEADRLGGRVRYRPPADAG